MDQILKDRFGMKIGEIRNVHGMLLIFDRHGNKLGHYEPSTNLTFDTHNNVVGQGNLLTTLLVNF